MDISDNWVDNPMNPCAKLLPRQENFQSQGYRKLNDC